MSESSNLSVVSWATAPEGMEQSILAGKQMLGKRLIDGYKVLSKDTKVSSKSTTTSSGSDTGSGSTPVFKQVQEHSCPPQFVYLLHDFKDEEYFGTYQYYKTSQNLYPHTPRLPEVLTLLKLFKCFNNMKKMVLKYHHTKNPSISSNTIWKAFLGKAIRRFIIFISILKAKFPDPKLVKPMSTNKLFDMKPGTSSFSKTMNELLPPIDIVLVWYCFHMFIGEAYDNYSRNNFTKFLFHPFPLYQVNKAIKNDDFSYNPLQFQKNNFEDLIREYDYDLPFDDLYNLSIQFPVKCPNCYNTLIDNCKLVDFIDSNFKIDIGDSNCKCQFNLIITHENLKIRQLYADLNKDPSIPMPTIYNQRFCQLQGLNPNDIDIECDDSFFKDLAFDPNDDPKLKQLIQLFEKISQSPNLNNLQVLKTYQTYNLWHLTIPSNKLKKVYPIEISSNVLSLINIEEDFISKLNQLDLLQSDHIEKVYRQSLDKYLKFMTLFKNLNYVISTLDIDLIWHVHQLSLYSYYQTILPLANKLTDRNQQLDKNATNEYFVQLNNQFKSIFNQFLTNCHCEFCYKTRLKSTKVKFLLKNLKKKDLISNYNVGLSHISRYNAIILEDSPSSSSSSGIKSPRSFKEKDKFDKKLKRRSRFLGGAKFSGIESQSLNLTSNT